MGLWDRLRDRRKKSSTQTSSATGSLDSSVSVSSTSSSLTEAQQATLEAQKQREAEIQAEREAEAARLEAERLAAEEAARLEAERQAAAAARQQAEANSIAAKEAVTTGTTTSLTDVTDKLTEETVTTDGLGSISLGGEGLLSPTAPPSDDAISGVAQTGLSTFGSNLDAATSITTVEKTPAELEAERLAAAKAREDAAKTISDSLSTTTTTDTPTLSTLSVSTSSEPVLLSDPAAAIAPTTLSEPTILSTEPVALSEPMALTEPIAVLSEPVVALAESTTTETTGLAEGTTRLLDNIYATPSTDPLVTTSPTADTASLLSTEPVLEASPDLLSAEPSLMTAMTTETLVEDSPTPESVISDALAVPETTAIETQVSYEPTSSINSGFQLLTDGGVNTDPYAAVDGTKIEQAIAGSGSTMDSYNTLFDKYYADYFVDETLTPEEAEAFLSSAPTTTLADVRTDTRSYEPSSKVENLLTQGAQWMNPKGGMIYVPESEGYTIPPEMLALIAERRKLRQAEGLPVRDEGKFWTLDADGNVIPKVFSQPMGYRGSTGVNAGAAGGADTHGFFKGTRAQKRAIMRNYKKRGGKLLSSDKGIGFAVDFYDDADDTWDVYGYDFPTATSPGSLVPKFFESTDRDKAQKVYDTWLKAYQVKYQGATPAQRAASRRQAAAKAKTVTENQIRRQEIRQELREKRKELRKATKQGVRQANNPNAPNQNAQRNRTAPNPGSVVNNVSGGRVAMGVANPFGGGMQQQAPRQQAPRNQGFGAFGAQAQLKNIGGNTQNGISKPKGRKVGMPKMPTFF